VGDNVVTWLERGTEVRRNHGCPGYEPRRIALHLYAPTAPRPYRVCMNTVADGRPIALDPAQALRPGRFDATALWAVWCLRRAAVPLLWLGLVGATLGGQADVSTEQFQSPREFLAALLSPAAGIAVAIAVRVLAGVGALVLAYPLAHAATAGDGRWSALRVRPWFDRYYLTRALRAWRWTSPVRELAAERLGASGRMWRRWSLALAVANPVAFVIAIVVLAAMGS
jgi:hypothetical protein